jgi:hypothetical protein
MNEEELDGLLRAPLEYVEDGGFTDRVVAELPAQAPRWSQLFNALQVQVALAMAFAAVVFAAVQGNPVVSGFLDVARHVAFIPSMLMSFPVAAAVGSAAMSVVAYLWAVSDA